MRCCHKIRSLDSDSSKLTAYATMSSSEPMMTGTLCIIEVNYMYRVVGGVLKAPVDDNGSAIVLTGVGTEYCSFNMNGNIV